MGTHPIFESDFDCLTDMFNRFVTVRLRKVSDLGHVTKESFLQSTVGKSRHESVDQALRNRARFYKKEDRPSFVMDEIFGRFEQGVYFPKFRFPISKVSRLNWFREHPRFLYPTDDPLAEVARESPQTFWAEVKSRFLANERNGTEENIVAQCARDVFRTSQIAKQHVDNALAYSHHCAALEVVKNFSKSLDVRDGELISICLTEDFAGDNPLHFDTVIEDFADNVLLNGSKTGVRVATEADHFLVFSSTIVKDRDDELYKRLTTILIPSDTEGVYVEPITGSDAEMASGELSRVHFEDVEIEPEWIVGQIGFGSQSLAHLNNVGGLLYSSVALSLLEDKFEKFKSDAQEKMLNGELWKESDCAIEAAAECNLLLLKLDSMIRQVILRRNFLFDDLESDVQAVKVYAEKVKSVMEKLDSFYPESDYESVVHLNAIQRTFGNKLDLLASIGYRGIRANYRSVGGFLANRAKSGWGHNVVITMGWWYRRRQETWMVNKSPKVMHFGKTGLGVFGTHIFAYEQLLTSNAYSEWTTYVRGMAEHFVKMYDMSGKIFADRTGRMIELHGGDINSDEYMVARLADVAVEHFALGALYARLKSDESLDEYSDLLVRNIIILEAQVFSETADKYQLIMDVEHRFNYEVRPHHAKKLADTRAYPVASPMVIENVYKENRKFLSNVEKLKLLDG